MTPSPSVNSSSLCAAPVPTWLISGFLGAGKTSFVLERLKSKGTRIAVLVNEFGELGIDGALIREQGGIEVVEMPGGCICCSQKEGVAESIRSIALQLRPELLLIEPSGIAETSELLGVLTEPSLLPLIRLDASIVLLDAETFLEYAEPDVFGTFFLDQIAHADLVLVNKADLVGAAQLAAVERRVAEINPKALVQQTTFGRLEGEPPGAWERVTSGVRASLPALECVSLVPGAELTDAKLQLFLDRLSLGTFGRVLRAKGFLPGPEGSCLNLQMVTGRVTMEPFRTGASPRLTLIGYRLEGERLRSFFGQTAEEA